MGPCLALKELWEFKHWFPRRHVSCVVMNWFLSMGPIRIPKLLAGDELRGQDYAQNHSEAQHFLVTSPVSNCGILPPVKPICIMQSLIIFFQNLIASKTFQKQRSGRSWTQLDAPMSTTHFALASEIDTQWIQSTMLIEMVKSILSTDH